MVTAPVLAAAGIYFALKYGVVWHQLTIVRAATLLLPLAAAICAVVVIGDSVDIITAVVTAVPMLWRRASLLVSAFGCAVAARRLQLHGGYEAIYPLCAGAAALVAIRHAYVVWR